MPSTSSSRRACEQRPKEHGVGPAALSDKGPSPVPKNALHDNELCRRGRPWSRNARKESLKCRNIRKIDIPVSFSVQDAAAGIHVECGIARWITAWPRKANHNTGPVVDGYPPIAVDVTKLAFVSVAVDIAVWFTLVRKTVCAAIRACGLSDIDRIGHAVFVAVGRGPAAPQPGHRPSAAHNSSHSKRQQCGSHRHTASHTATSISKTTQPSSAPSNPTEHLSLAAIA